jgi:hypothetical protein
MLSRGVQQMLPRGISAEMSSAKVAEPKGAAQHYSADQCAGPYKSGWKAAEEGGKSLQQEASGDHREHYAHVMQNDKDSKTFIRTPNQIGKKEKANDNAAAHQDRYHQNTIFNASHLKPYPVVENYHVWAFVVAMPRPQDYSNGIRPDDRAIFFAERVNALVSTPPVGGSSGTVHQPPFHYDWARDSVF